MAQVAEVDQRKPRRLESREPEPAPEIAVPQRTGTASWPLFSAVCRGFEKVRAGSLLGITLGGMGTLSVWLFLTHYVQQVHGYSVVAGLCFLPLSLALISASAITTRLTARIGSRPLTVTEHPRSRKPLNRKKGTSHS